MRNFGKILIILLIIGAGAAAVYLIFLKTKSQEEKIARLNEQIEFLKSEQMPIRYKIKSRENGKTNFIVKFYDLENNKISKEKFSLKGSTISFDFYVVEFKEGYIAFPYKIFSDEVKAEDGIVLFKYYEKNNFPMTYFRKDASKVFNEGIEALFEKIKSGDIEDIDNIFGSMVQNNTTLATKNRDVDKWYKIIVHTKGGIEIIED